MHLKITRKCILELAVRVLLRSIGLRKLHKENNAIYFIQSYPPISNKHYHKSTKKPQWSHWKYCQLLNK